MILALSPGLRSLLICSLPTLDTLGRIILHLLRLSQLVSHLSRPALETFGRVFLLLSLCLSPCLNTLGWMMLRLLHLSPLVSHLSRPTLESLGRIFFHLSLLVFLLVSLLRYSWLDDLHLLHLPLVSHLSPCLDLFHTICCICLHLPPTCLGLLWIHLAGCFYTCLHCFGGKF